VKCAVFGCRAEGLIPAAFVAGLCVPHARLWQASFEAKRVAHSTDQFDMHFMDFIRRIDAEERNGSKDGRAIDVSAVDVEGSSEPEKER